MPGAQLHATERSHLHVRLRHPVLFFSLCALTLDQAVSHLVEGFRLSLEVYLSFPLLLCVYLTAST